MAHTLLQPASPVHSVIDVLGKIGITDKGTYPGELSFPGGRYVIAIVNLSSGKLKIDDMLATSESF